MTRTRSQIGFEGLVSKSPVMWEIFETCKRVAPTTASVLILGETGTGKELLARAIHKESGRSGRFVAVNCGAVTESLIESELFGYEKGSFTGAVGSKTGLFRHADRGTIFLDEIGNLPLSAQFSLLRALQEGAVRPVGGHEEIPIDVRVISATSVPLDRAVQEHRFREDLLYRLDVIRVIVPPLRERREDVLFLFETFCEEQVERHHVEAPELTESFVEDMLAYPWPGNVRQLENFTERLVLTQSGARLTAGHFQHLMRPYMGEEPSGEAERRVSEPAVAVRPPGPATPQAPSPGVPQMPRPGGPPAAPPPAGGPPSGSPGSVPMVTAAAVDLSRTLTECLDPVILDLERRYLEAALTVNDGRIQATANTAGLSRRTLLRKLKKHGLDKRDYTQRARRAAERARQQAAQQAAAAAAAGNAAGAA